MQTIKYLIQTKLESAPNSDGAKLQPFFQQAYQAFYLRALVDSNHVKIHAIALFQICGGKEMRHYTVDIYSI